MDSLETWYDREFKMKYFLHYSKQEFEDLLPFEVDILIGLYNIQIKKEQEQQRKENSKMSASMPSFKAQKYK